LFGARSMSGFESRLPYMINTPIDTTIDAKKRLLLFWKESGVIQDESVLKAFETVPREKFVMSSHKDMAYEDVPLPLIKGQTISQPSTASIMTQALELKKGQKVLEVGAGSGYQAALIANIVGPKGKVVTTEIIPGLAELARKNIAAVGIKNVEVHQADGSIGFPAEAPFDRIIITAAAPKIPEELLQQLSEEGIIVAPVAIDDVSFTQEMIVGKKKNGKVETKSLGYFTFVPLRGKFGYE